MRYEEGRLDQFFGEEKVISAQEKEYLIREHKRRGIEMLGVGARKLRNEITGSDLNDIYTNDDQRAYVEQIQKAAEQQKAENPERKKRSKWPLIFLGVMVLAVIIAAMSGNVIFAIGAFLVLFAFFGFYSVITGNDKGSNYYEGKSSSASRSSGLVIGFVGLAGVIPLLFTGLLGQKAALTLMTAALFATVAISMIVLFIKSIGLKDRKYTEEVSANCVGYSRIIESHTSTSNGSTRHYYTFTTSPVFEYTYQGKEYKGVYDRMIDGVNADIDMGPAMISIDPDHPEDIYHKSTKADVKGLLISAVCIAIAVVCVIFFINGDHKADEKKPGVSGKNVFALIFGSEDEKKAAFGSIADDLSENDDDRIPEVITDDFVEAMNASMHYDGATWYCEVLPFTVEEQEGNNYNIVFDDDRFPTVCCSGDPDDLGDEMIVFYITYDAVYDNVPYVGKEIIWYTSAEDHHYVGNHGAYEG